MAAQNTAHQIAREQAARRLAAAEFAAHLVARRHAVEHIDAQRIAARQTIALRTA